MKCSVVLWLLNHCISWYCAILKKSNDLYFTNLLRILIKTRDRSIRSKRQGHFTTCSLFVTTNDGDDIYIDIYIFILLVTILTNYEFISRLVYRSITHNISVAHSGNLIPAYLVDSAIVHYLIFSIKQRVNPWSFLS